MKQDWNQVVQGTVLPAILAAMLFFVPVSTSFRAIFMLTATGLIVALAAYRPLILASLKTSWAGLAIVFFLLSVLALFWTTAQHHEYMPIISKYSKLLYLPILAAGFAMPRARDWGIKAYLLAILLTCVLSLLKSWQWISMHHDNDPGHIFHDHIMTGFLVAYGAYLAAVKAYQSRKWSYYVLTVLFSYQVLFVNTGRTGYILYALLVGLFCLQFFSLRQALIGLLTGIAALVTVYTLSPVMRVGLDALAMDVQQYQMNQKDTSLGFRFQFHRYAHQLFAKSPIWGQGTGSFTHQFSVDQPIPSWGPSLLEPHSQYWLIAAEQGGLGLALYLFLLFSMAWAVRTQSGYRPVMLGLLACIAAASFTDSMLLYGATGYLLVAMGALCLGGTLRQTHQVAKDSCGIWRVQSSETEPSRQSTTPLSVEATPPCH